MKITNRHQFNYVAKYYRMRVESGGQAVGDKEGSFLLKQKILKSFFKYTQEIDSNITTIKQNRTSLSKSFNDSPSFLCCFISVCMSVHVYVRGGEDFCNNWIEDPGNITHRPLIFKI